jgi:hypothetical protein
MKNGVLAKAPIIPKMMTAELSDLDWSNDCFEEIPNVAVSTAALDEDAEPVQLGLVDVEETAVGGVVAARGIEKAEDMVAMDEEAIEDASSDVFAAGLVGVGCVDLSISSTSKCSSIMTD